MYYNTTTPMTFAISTNGFDAHYFDCDMTVDGYGDDAEVSFSNIIAHDRGEKVAFEDYLIAEQLDEETVLSEMERKAFQSIFA